jgi:hypothetical protein
LFSVSEGAKLYTISSSWFSIRPEKIQLFASWFSLSKSHTGSFWVFLHFRDVFTVLSSTFRCRSWLSSPSSDIAAVCRLGPLSTYCLVAVVVTGQKY